MTTKKVETVIIGPVRIPKPYKEGLAKILEEKPHLTYSDLIRDALFLYLKEKGYYWEGDIDD
jgi:hypothetical protein